MGFPNILGPNAFLINRKPFKLNYNEYNVPLNNTEIWQITSSSIFGHPFHIHDVEFNILSINGVAPDATQAGWKDVVFVPGRTGNTNSVVKFIAKFDDFADPLHPFMYHCHIALHEDEGMMGQFIVTNTTATQNLSPLNNDFNIYPNPASDNVTISYFEEANVAVVATIYTSLGQKVSTQKVTTIEGENKMTFNVNNLSKGMYILEMISNGERKIQKFTIQK
jgi:hypothetical protein